MMFISVDLPDPDAPMTATNSPGRSQRHSAQRVHLNLAQIVGLEDAFEPDGRRVCRRLPSSVLRESGCRSALVMKVGGGVAPSGG